MKRLGLFLAVFAGCYSPNPPDGTQMCSSDKKCEDGYFCGPDNFCYKVGHKVPDMAVGDLTVACTADSCKDTPKPYCDPDSNQCVECLKDDNCPSGKVCSQKACVPGCNDMHGCPDGGGACTNGMCAACKTDNDCSGQTPRCDTNSGLCVACLPVNDNCPQGFVCNQVNGTYTCAMGCKTAADCPAGDGGAQNMACCNQVCVDLNSDGKHCGDCNTDCGNQACCAGFCSDVTSDLANCGGCGRQCTGGNASWMCAQSMCVPTCKANFGDCDGNPGNGCETNLLMDVNNCKACGTPCTLANANNACTNGACGIASCKAGYANCNNQAGDGCEIFTDGDANNCGACGNVCNLAHAMSGCVAGKCVITGCLAGFSNCNNLDGDGCEAATSSDVNNCGNCGMKCNGIPNGTPSCVNSGCVPVCSAGFRDCNGIYADGCEANLNTDVANCGGCGRACSGANVAAKTCAGGLCTSTCAAGFGNCIRPVAPNADDGCETNTTNDKNNCGGCGVACQVNFSCANSMCTNVVFPNPSYNASMTFTDGLMGTTMMLTWDGSSFWSCSGGSNTGVRFAQYNANGGVTATFQPNIDFRACFTKGGNTSPVYVRPISTNILEVQTAPGVFANSVTLAGGAIDAQGGVVFNENGTEFVTLNGGSIYHWTNAGVFINSFALAGFGTMNNENTYPQNRGVVKAGGYYLTYSAGVLSAWDGNGNRVKTTILNGAGTSFDSYFGLSYARGMVWIVDVAGGTWRGYNVGL